MTNKLSSEDLDKIVENQCFHLPYFRARCWRGGAEFLSAGRVSRTGFGRGFRRWAFRRAMLTQTSLVRFRPWLEPAAKRGNMGFIIH